MTTLEILTRLNACDEAKDWARSISNSPRIAWEVCPRGDWLLWLALEAGVNQPLLLRGACQCAKLVTAHVDWDNFQKLIGLVEAWRPGASESEIKALEQEIHAPFRDAWHNLDAELVRGRFALYVARQLAESITWNINDVYKVAQLAAASIFYREGADSGATVATARAVRKAIPFRDVWSAFHLHYHKQAEAVA
jgi:hypothetical protein